MWATCSLPGRRKGGGGWGFGIRARRLQSAGQAASLPHIVKTTRLAFLLLAALSRLNAQDATAPEWSKSWTIVRLSIPAKSDLKDAYVELQTPAGRAVTLTTGISTEDGVTLEKVEWVGSPVRAKVTLRKGQERAEIFAEAALVSKNDDLQPRLPQVEIESKFLEVSDALAESLKFPGGASFLDKFAGMPAPASGSRALSVRAVLNEKDAEQFLTTLTAPKGAGEVAASGVDLLSAPRVTTRSQQRAMIEIIREFRYPSEWNPPAPTDPHWTPKSFETRNVGVTLDVEPTLLEGEVIDLQVTPQVIEFLGFVDFETKEPLFAAKRDATKSIPERTLASAVGFESRNRPTQPIFSTRQTHSSVALKSGQTLVLVGSGESEETKPFDPPSAGRQLVVLIRASTVRPEESFAPGEPLPPPPTPTAPPTASDVPTAAAVKGKPGFVISPHAPKAGYIDVRGFPPGTEVRDPYSGKMFRVP
ncbi:MAG: ral secretion pathway protein [Chthoniobacter sp.]|jgi:hypothetical protein|nr:ral secretion pathway protein [Chthoniobacter sp.]